MSSTTERSYSFTRFGKRPRLEAQSKGEQFGSGITAVFLGGTHITISGPAAGLAPAVCGAIVQLGHSDVAIGYPLSFLEQQAENGRHIKLVGREKFESLTGSKRPTRLLNIQPEQLLA